ncbi:DUF2948 family protein [Acuticoccus sp.]|uniref:DUF2948 family protein n=1 Tax=Acuticoccus sp. TaxID=1904378 RepID=UPI003B51F73B
MTPVRPVKLFALDEEDLAVLSAHVQDAVAKVADIRWSPSVGSFAIPMNRFAWERATVGRVGREPDERRRSVLSFARVGRARVTGIVAGDRAAVVSILAVLFEAGEAPAGVVTVACSGGVAIRLDVECIEARLVDLGAAWGASMRPKHVTGGS